MNAKQRNAQAFDLKVRELLALGMTVSAIAKHTDRTYRHTANVAARIRADLAAAEEPADANA